MVFVDEPHLDHLRRSAVLLMPKISRKRQRLFIVEPVCKKQFRIERAGFYVVCEAVCLGEDRECRFVVIEDDLEAFQALVFGG